MIDVWDGFQAQKIELKGETMKGEEATGAREGQMGSEKGPTPKFIHYIQV